MSHEIRPAADRRLLFAEFLSEWRLAGESRARPCPNKVVGGVACQTRTSRGSFRTSLDVGCPCDAGGWKDHAGMWLDEDGGYVFAAQPYMEACGPADVAMLRRWCEARGADLCACSSRSWRYPGRTQLIVISQHPGQKRTGCWRAKA